MRQRLHRAVFFFSLASAACSGEIEDPAGAADEPSQSVDAIDCRDPVVAPTPLRRLTRRQYNNTIRDVFGFETNAADGFPADDRAGPFPANYRQPVASMHVNRFMEAAEQIADEAMAHLPSILPCDPAVGDRRCAEQFIRDKGSRAFRRPIDEEAVEGLLAVYDAGTVEGFQSGIRLVISAMLQAPDFLYHVEEMTPGEPVAGNAAKLSGFELTSRLSYFLWNTVPDDELLAAAESGALDTPEGLRAEAVRLLNDSRANEAIEQFFIHWLGIGAVPNLTKDPQKFLYFNEFDGTEGKSDVRQAMFNETMRFVRYVMRQSDASLWTLMTANYSFLEAPLFPIYGMREPADHDPEVPITYQSGERSGVLTQASVMASHSFANSTAIVGRGNFVLRNFLCIYLTPPPIEVPPAPLPNPNQTTRERFEQHRQGPCSECHAYMDPIGFGLENYDADGSWRTMENSIPVDASGELSIGDPMVDGPFTGAKELVDKLMMAERMHRCIPEQWVQFALQREDEQLDSCDQERLYRRFVASGLDMRALILDIVTSDTFRYRPANPEENNL